VQLTPKQKANLPPALQKAVAKKPEPKAKPAPKKK
jgi:hypothetical protein